jgi:hypothetical protein
MVDLLKVHGFKKPTKHGGNNKEREQDVGGVH